MRQLLVCATLFASAASASAEAPFFDGTFDDACKTAREKGKVVMMDFYTTWCGPCKMLDRYTWPDQSVQNWMNERVVALKVDAEKNRPLAARYQIRSFPTMVFIRPDGSELGRTIGFQQPQVFLNNAKRAVGGNDGKAPAKETPEVKPADTGVAKGLDKIKLARELAGSGKHKEALDELLWCYDHGDELGAGFARIRLSTVLDEIVNVSKSYPTAIDQLARRRDQTEENIKKILAIPGIASTQDRAVIHNLTSRVLEATALNRVLNESKRQLTLYETLSNHGELGLAIQRMMFNDVLDLLLNQRRYSDIVNLAGDVFQRIETKIKQCDQAGQSGSNLNQRAQSNLNVYLKQQVIIEAGKYYEALLGVGRLNEAQKLGQRIVQFDPSTIAFTTLLQHAMAAKAFDAAKEVVGQAEATLKPGELVLIRKMAASLPAT